MTQLSHLSTRGVKGCETPCVYYKFTMEPNEAEITIKMSELEISPKLLECRTILGCSILVMERYPMDLSDCKDDEYTTDVMDQIDALIDRMHKAGVIHGDLRLPNMVISHHPPLRSAEAPSVSNLPPSLESGVKGGETPCVKLIDFGKSKWMDQFSAEDTNDLIEFYASHLDGVLTKEIYLNFIALDKTDPKSFDKAFYKLWLRGYLAAKSADQVDSSRLGGQRGGIESSAPLSKVDRPS